MASRNPFTAELSQAAAPVAIPDRTILLRGGESLLTPDPAGFAYQVGETVAFVVTNESDGDSVFAIAPAGANAEMAGGDMIDHGNTVAGASTARVLVEPVETATLVYEFAAPGEAVVTWSRSITVHRGSPSRLRSRAPEARFTLCELASEMA